MLTLTHLGDVQLSALEIYVLDPIHAENGDEFPGTVEGSRLLVPRADRDRACEMLLDAANTADPECGPRRTKEEQEDPLTRECDALDRAMGEALFRLASRLRRLP